MRQIPYQEYPKILCTTIQNLVTQVTLHLDLCTHGVWHTCWNVQSGKYRFKVVMATKKWM